MKKQLLLLAGCLSGTLAVAQTTIEFTYDNAGNRTSRIVQTSKQMQDSTFLNDPSMVENETLNNQEFLTAMKVSLYPNPTTDHFTLELSNYDGTELSYSIISQIGELHDKGIISQATSVFNTSKLSAGVYFLELKSSKTMLTKKLVIK